MGMPLAKVTMALMKEKQLRHCMATLSILSEILELTYKGIVAMVLVLCPSSSPDHNVDGASILNLTRIGSSRFLTASQRHPHL